MTIHWCGTGLSALPGLRALIEEGRPVTVWNRSLDKARAALAGLDVPIRAFVPEDLAAALQPGDIAVSMLPASWHVPLARLCMERGAHFISSSYISPEMRALDSEARERGLCLVNEVGLDPGIDHLMAHELVAAYRAAPQFDAQNTLSFISYCGGVPYHPNAFRYKFSWSPLGVLTALKSPSVSIRNHTRLEVSRPWDALGTYDAPLDPPETFEVYPNRDSLPFIEEYGFDPAWPLREFVRGTLRLNGWADAWAEIFARIEALEDAPQDAAMAELTGLSEQLWDAHAYGPDEPDRVVLCVSLKAEKDGRPVWHRTHTLDAWGDARGSAMARLVSGTVALAARAIEAREIHAGVTAAPSAPHLTARWLEATGHQAQHMAVIDHLKGA